MDVLPALAHRNVLVFINTPEAASGLAARLRKEGFKCDIKLNVDNAFAVNLLNENLNHFETLARVAIATAYALAQSQKANSKSPGYLVTNINRMLTEFLSGSN